MENAITAVVRKIVREEVQAARKPPERSRDKACCEHCPGPLPMHFDGYEPTWTTAQVAEFMGVAVKTIRNRVSLGTFPKPRKQGRLNAFVPSEVAAYRAQILGLNAE